MPGSSHQCPDSGGRYEPDTAALQFLDVVQAIDQGTAKAVQLPDQDQIEFPCPGIVQPPVQSWSAGLGTAMTSR